jgi:DNA repair exonuclease SbcCD nuclease subunit
VAGHLTAIRVQTMTAFDPRLVETLGLERRMRLLVFSDLHLDAPFAWAGPQLGRARRLALRACLTRICELAHQLRVDVVCCAGDLFEQDRYTPDTAAFLRETFADLHPLPVLIAPGNHDWLGPASLYAQVDWSPNVVIFDEVRFVPRELAPGLTMWGAAHRNPANTRGFFDDGFRVDRAGIHLGLFHGSEQGDGWPNRGVVPHAPFRAAQVPESGLHHALVGHFHTPRDAPFYTYPGNPEPLVFGETGERGAVEVKVAHDGTVSRTRHRVAVTTVVDTEVDLTGAAHADEVRTRVRAHLAGLTGTVRVTLTGEVAPSMDVELRDLGELAPHLDAVVGRLGHLDYAYDFDELAREQTVRGQFVRDVRDAGDLDPEQRRRVLVTGLRAFAGRTDLAVR